MPGELIVRIFLYGLILVVPHGNDTPNDPTDDTLVAYLVRDPDHAPKLRYCQKFKENEPQVCEKATGDKQPLQGWSVSFEFANAVSGGVEGENAAAMGPREEASPSPSAAARRYRCDPMNAPPTRGVSRCDRNGFPPMQGHPAMPDNGTDFDWFAKLGEVLNDPGPIDTSPSKYAATVRVTQGTASVCEFVKVREKCVIKDGDEKKFVVPLISFEDSNGPGSNFVPRAVASSLVVELVGQEAQDFIVNLGKLGDPNTRPIRPDRRPCSDHGRPLKDSCIEISITNLPKELSDPVECGEIIDDNIRNLRGTHWQHYYDLPHNVQGNWYPQPVRAKIPGDLPTEKKVVPACLVYPPPKEGKETTWVGQLAEGIELTEDRPICPIGTP